MSFVAPFFMLYADWLPLMRRHKVGWAWPNFKQGPEGLKGYFFCLLVTLNWANQPLGGDSLWFVWLLAGGYWSVLIIGQAYNLPYPCNLHPWCPHLCLGDLLPCLTGMTVVREENPASFITLLTQWVFHNCFGDFYWEKKSLRHAQSCNGNLPGDKGWLYRWDLFIKLCRLCTDQR